MADWLHLSSAKKAIPDSHACLTLSLFLPTTMGLNSSTSSLFVASPQRATRHSYSTARCGTHKHSLAALKQVLASSRRNSRKNSPSFPNKNRNASRASFGDVNEPPVPPPAAGAAARGACDGRVASAASVVSPLAWKDSRACTSEEQPRAPQCQQYAAVFHQSLVKKNSSDTCITHTYTNTWEERTA